MTRKLADYSKGQIYTIRSLSNPKLIYVGSTTDTKSRRFSRHKSNYKLNKYCASHEILKRGDAYCELHELFPCECRDQLEAREGQVIREFLKQKLTIVNCIVPKATWEEHQTLNLPNKISREQLRLEKQHSKWFAGKLEEGRQWLTNIRHDMENMSDEDIVKEWETEEKRRGEVRSIKFDKQYPACVCGETLYWKQWMNNGVGNWDHSRQGRETHDEWMKKKISVCECGSLVKKLSSHIKTKKHMFWQTTYDFIYS